MLLCTYSFKGGLMGPSDQDKASPAITPQSSAPSLPWWDLILTGSWVVKKKHNKNTNFCLESLPSYAQPALGQKTLDLSG